MSISDVRVTIQDGALGTLPLGPNTTRVKVGVSTSGTAGTLYTINSVDDARTYLGAGPLAEACAYDVQIGGPGIIACPIVANVAANSSGFSGSGTATHSAGTGPAITLTGTPIRPYDVQVVCNVTAGARGTAYISYSLDGGVSWSPQVITAATVALYEPPYTSAGISTGITLNIASGTFVTTDVYSFRAFGAHYDSTTSNGGTGLAAVFAALSADPRDFTTIHFVGSNMGSSTDATNVTACNNFITALQSQMNSLATAFRYVRAFVDAPDLVVGGSLGTTNALDTALISTMASQDAPRVGLGGGHCDVYSPLSGLALRVAPTWPILARVAQNVGAGSYSDDVAWVGSPYGSLKGVRALWRDERVSQTFSDARILSLRTHIRRAGYYATSSNMLAVQGSDYTYMPNGLVIDLFASTLRAACLPFLNQSILVNPDGTIFETDALAIESELASACLSVLGTNISPVTASTPIVKINRTNNILSTSTMQVKGRITPRGYARQITVDLGFNVTNKVLAQV